MKEFYLKPNILTSLKGYNGSKFAKDLIAGVIVAIIALPLSIALALASGANPERGVYSAIFAGFTVSLFGGSCIQIAGPTAAFAAIVAGIIGKKGFEGLIIATVMAGIILIIMGICKVGALIRFVPSSITVGFTSGIAVTILIGQLKDFFGIKYAAGVTAVETVDKLKEDINAISTISPTALAIGIVCLLILIVYPKFEKRVPPSLIAVIVGALAVKFIPGLSDGVSTIGDLYTIPQGLPKFAFSGISLSTEKIVNAIPDAFTIAVLAAIESLLSCVVADRMVDAKHNPNAELTAQGLGNILSVMFGGIPATGAIARTAANAKNGGRTPIAGMVHAVVLLLVLLFFIPYAELIPMPTIAAILFMVAYNMSEWRGFTNMLKTAKWQDKAVLLVTFVLTVAFDLVVAIGVGLALYVVFILINKATDRNKSKYK